MVETLFKIFIIGVIVAISIGFIGTVVFSWTLDTSSYLKGLTSFLSVIFYVLPIDHLSPLIFCFLALMSFRIAISIIKTIWNLLPIRG